MMSLKPEPVSAIFLPVKSEQNIPFPLRLEVDVMTADMFLYVFIVVIIISSFSIKYFAKINKVSLPPNFFSIISQNK
jgi:NADH:ubiquinone oxidoreductase subunit 5 (subunit L)/multisubunit Na+/H+ antiporter MnhA subunit